MIEAIIYDINIIPIAMHNHNRTEVIKEICVPDFCLFVNSYHCFVDKTKNRLNAATNKRNIVVDNKLVTNLIKYIEEHDKIKDSINTRHNHFVETYMERT